MSIQAALEQREQVVQFLRKHRIGLLTLLFTDIVGSTQLKQDLGDTPALLSIQRHHALVRELLGQFAEAEEISGAGDSFFIVFAKPSEAVKFALLLQARLRELAQQSGVAVLDRVGIHLGEVFIEAGEAGGRPKDLYGLQVDVCARVMSLAEGGPVLLTRSPFDNARQVLKGQEFPGLKGLAWLHHGPYVLKGVEEPPYYLETEYVAGRDLRSWCERQGGVERVPLETRLEIVAQVAEALQAAHEAGVIPRDVKPSNILVRGEGRRAGGEELPGEAGRGVPTAPPLVGQASGSLETASPTLKVKLTDFGIGQVVSAEYLAGMTRAGFTQTLLAPGSSAQTGTQMYLAPELMVGKPASPRSDLYSLGVVLYQLLVGDFDQPLTTDWAKEVTDPLLREDLARCFAGNPQERFAGARELGENLRRLPQRQDALAAQQAVQAAREQAAYGRGVMRAAGLAAVIVAIILGLALLANRERSVAQRHLYVANMNLAQQAWEQNNVGRVRQLLEETAAHPGRGFEWYYWQRQTHLAWKTLRGHLGPVLAVAFSPDGRRVVTGSEDWTAKVWEAATGKQLLTLKVAYICYLMYAQSRHYVNSTQTRGSADRTNQTSLAGARPHATGLH